MLTGPRLRWLYPASSEPPPPDAVAELVEYYEHPHRLPVWPKPWTDFFWFEDPPPDIPDDDVPWVGGGWTQIFGTWFPEALYGEVLVETVQEFVFIDPPWVMPQFHSPRQHWMERVFLDREDFRPPPRPPFEEEPHPEVEFQTLPVWLPWRPIPELEYWNDEQEETFIDKYESPHRLPVWPIPHMEFLAPFQPQEDEPAPEIGFDFIPPMDLLPIQRPFFMPDLPPFFSDEQRPGKCPPPCLRRPDKRC